MRKEPKVTDKCAQCGGPRIVEQVNKQDDDHPFKTNDLKGRKPAEAAQILAARENDPFCSSSCARAYYGVPLLAKEKPGPVPKGIHHGTESGYNRHKCKCERCKAAATDARRERRQKQGVR